MNLYLLKRRGITNYDEAHGFVVRAPNAREARSWAATKAGDEGATTWTTPSYSTCVRLSSVGPPGIILRNFRAG